MKEENLIPISRMASLHGISRQTLILYDKIGLLKPAYTNEAGYRFYSAKQIPYLREIYFLKSIGISLNDINKYQQDRTTVNMIELLDKREQVLEHDIKELKRQREFLCQRKSLLAHISAQIKNINKPFIEWIPKRKVLFSPFISEDMDDSKLHLTLMKAWDQIIGNGMLPSKGFGAILKLSSIEVGTPLKNAGSIINIPLQKYMGEANVLNIRAGEYVTMYKYGMPYDVKSVHWLLQWMNENSYEPDEDIVDICLLDTTLYNEEHQEDFCRLEVPIKNSYSQAFRQGM